MKDSEAEAASPFAESRRWAPRKSLLERLPEIACQITLVAMIVVIASEVIYRTVTGASMEISDEVGGYLLVTLTFLALPVCQVDHAFHRVEFIAARLSERGRAISDLFFDVLSGSSVALLFWQVTRLELTTWRSEDVAPTSLMTPLWIPQLPMAVGFGILCLTFVRTLWRDARRLRAAFGRSTP